MSTPYTVKIQTDATGASVLIYPTCGDDFHVQLEGDEAQSVIRGYDLIPLGKIYARAEVDENGLLSLGDEVLEADT